MVCKVPHSSNTYRAGLCRKKLALPLILILERLQLSG